MCANTEYQLCFIHGIYLAVCECTLKQKNIWDESTTSDIDENDDEELNFPDSGLDIFRKNDIIKDIFDLTNEYTFTTDAAFKYHFKELFEKNSILADKMRICLHNCTKKRRS